MANELFRSGAIGFLDIPRLVSLALDAADSKPDYDLADVLATDQWAREFVRSHL